METTSQGTRLPVNIEDEIRQSYMDYAMSVIIGRALPDARDGLKPVHRRVLYAMYDLGNEWNRPYKKSARVVGDVIGKYHPHGDTAVYDTIVRMAQDFSMRHPLVDGQGNFGSIDGDPAAAMRYTEIRMARIAGEMLADLDKETVDFTPNYDETLREPVVLPARIPNLLINGSTGIAVGMTTNVPPHNLGEVVDGTIALIRNPQISIDELMQLIPGPDFPTAAFLHGRGPIRECYRTGHGILHLRARTSVETNPRNGREAIIVHELPYQVNKARLIERIAELVNDKEIDGIADLRDESDRDGMRVVIEIKRDAIADIVLNHLFKQTQMQSSFGAHLLAIVDNRPRLLTLKDALAVFVGHRKEVITRRTVFELRKAEERLHILEGLKIALDHLDEVIALIRAARDPEVARRGLIEKFGLTEVQAKAILEMRLQRLTGLERDKILEERRQTIAQIERYRQILSDEQEVFGIMVEELEEVKRLHGNPRRTEIVDDAGDLSIEDLIADEDMVVTISHEGYIKRSPVTEYRSQRRGGRGRLGGSTKEEDFLEHVFVASMHTYMLFFTTSGKAFWLKVHRIPQAGRAARGKAIVNLLELGAEEKISAFVPVKEFVPDRYVFFATRGGTVKKTDLLAYSNPRRAGIIAITLDEGDEVIGVRLTNGSDEIILSTSHGKAIRFREQEVRGMGRSAGGVRGIALDDGDRVVGIDVLDSSALLLSVSELGYGKRTPMEAYRLTGRGGKGILTMNTTDKVGAVIGVRMVREEAHIMVMTDGGKVIRTPVRGISVMSRNTQGVRLMDLAEGERVVGVATLPEEEEEAEGPESVPGAEPTTPGEESPV